MICSACRTDNPDSAAYCAGCGGALSPGAPSAGLRAPSRGLAIASLVLGLLSVPTFGLLLVGAVTSVILGVIALVKASQEPALYGGKELAVAGIAASAVSILIIPVLGIVAAIAIPSLMRARISANEVAAIEDVRSVVQAEATYSKANGGAFDTLECLHAADQCIPGYKGGAFLAPILATRGYRHHFLPGRNAHVAAGMSTSSLEAFAFTAVPVVRNRTGVRAFCGDDTGTICQQPLGHEPAVAEGHCVLATPQGSVGPFPACATQ
jgi:hypothetical protein